MSTTLGAAFGPLYPSLRGGDPMACEPIGAADSGQHRGSPGSDGRWQGSPHPRFEGDPGCPTFSDDDQRSAARTPRHPIRVELRLPDTPTPADEMRRREQELERLIIKAACHRAARLQRGTAEHHATGEAERDGDSPERSRDTALAG